MCGRACASVSHQAGVALARIGGTSHRWANEIIPVRCTSYFAACESRTTPPTSRLRTRYCARATATRATEACRTDQAAKLAAGRAADNLCPKSFEHLQWNFHCKGSKHGSAHTAHKWRWTAIRFGRRVGPPLNHRQPTGNSRHAPQAGEPDHQSLWPEAHVERVGVDICAVTPLRAELELAVTRRGRTECGMPTARACAAAQCRPNSGNAPGG